MTQNETIRIEVAYGSGDEQVLISLIVPAGTTVIQAIRMSNVKDQFPDVDFELAVKGIFSKLAENDSALRDHDRVEIYRPLVVDPREARRRRVKK